MARALTRTVLLTYTPALYAAGAACLVAAAIIMAIRQTAAKASTPVTPAAARA
jgi:hypothetical protein